MIVTVVRSTAPAPAAANRASAGAERRVGPLVRWPWALPVLASAGAWVVYGAAARVGGAGHARHVLLAVAMAVAMMGPFAVPLCISVARATVWRHAGRTVALAFATFVVVWVAVGVAMHLAAEAATAVVHTSVAVAALAAWSAADAASSRRSRRLAACAVSRPILPSARALGTVDAAAVAAWRCVSTCWAPMALTAVDGRPAVVVAVSAIIVVERVAVPRPRLAAAGAFVALAIVATWVGS